MFWAVRLARRLRLTTCGKGRPRKPARRHLMRHRPTGDTDHPNPAQAPAGL